MFYWRELLRWLIMGNKITVGFGKNDFVSEEQGLGKYLAVLDAARKTAANDNLTVVERDYGNIYEDMCRERIGNFAYGQKREIVASDGASEHWKVQTKLDVHTSLFTRCPSGYFEVWVTGSDESKLVAILQEAAVKAPSIGNDKLPATRESFKAGYQMCYGLCKED